MIEETVIVTPELAPGGGGVADYTLRLIEHLPPLENLRFVVPESDVPTRIPAKQYRVEQVEPSANALLAKLPSHGGKVLVQYSAYGFDRFGYPRWLINALLGWKEKSRGVLAIMFHEIWTFWPVLNKNWFVQQLHRRKLRKLLSVADAVFTSTESQARYLSALSPQCTVEVLPVGSNISYAGTPGFAREPALAVLFGLQSARVRTLQIMRGELTLLAAAGKITKIVTVGAGQTPQGEAEEISLLTKLGLREGFEQLGPQPEAEVSRLLSRAAFALSAQDHLSFSKSGSFMAYAAHGLNIVSLSGNVSKSEPLCWLTSPNELIEGLALNELNARAQHLRNWQERTSSWPRIAGQFARALRLENLNSPVQPISSRGNHKNIIG